MDARNPNVVVANLPLVQKPANQFVKMTIPFAQLKMPPALVKAEIAISSALMAFPIATQIRIIGQTVAKLKVTAKFHFKLELLKYLKQAGSNQNQIKIVDSSSMLMI